MLKAMKAPIKTMAASNITDLDAEPELVCQLEERTVDDLKVPRKKAMDLDPRVIYDVRADRREALGTDWFPVTGRELRQRISEVRNFGAVHAFPSTALGRGEFLLEIKPGDYTQARLSKRTVMPAVLKREFKWRKS